MEEIRIEEIVRSRRRTVALLITPDATLIVRAPLRAPLGYIQSLVRQKNDWIRRKLREASCRPKPRMKEFTEGEEFLYLGKIYKLCLREGAGPEIELADRLYLSVSALPRAAAVISIWYKSEALKLIKNRCELYEKVTGCVPAAVKISEARQRWGSCSAGKTLHFSWRLIMAPLEIIDYLIVHELAHIGQLNHSKQYWHKVASVLPDYKNREKWLRENGGLLTI